jgi:hypothetical protein
MLEFRCYFLNHQDRISAVETILAETAASAIEAAEAKLSEQRQYWSIEVWHWHQMVHRPKELPGRRT